MKFYLVIFDRQLDKSYKGFHETFVAHRHIFKWWHFIRSSYIVGTDLSVGDLSRHVRSSFEQNGLRSTHLVLRVDLSERQGMLPKGAWGWIRENAKDDNET